MSVKGKIVYPNGKQPKYVNGAFGGINNRGEFVANFFYELGVTPDEFEIQDNSIETFVPSKDMPTKTVEFSMFMSLETAKSIVAWMEANIKAAEGGDQ